jgi:hypothetical protein
MDDGGTFSEGCSHTHANTARTLVLVVTPKIALICGLHANCLYVSPKMPRFATHRIGSSGRSSFSSPENLLLNIVDHSPSTTHQRVTLLTTLIHQLPTPLHSHNRQLHLVPLPLRFGLSLNLVWKRDVLRQ